MQNFIVHFLLQEKWRRHISVYEIYCIYFHLICLDVLRLGVGLHSKLGEYYLIEVLWLVAFFSYFKSKVIPKI